MARSRSPWNAAIEHALGVAGERRLSASALRLYLAVLRYTLGWNRREASLGRRLLCDAAGMYGRTFERARTELVEAGLVAVDHGANQGPKTRSSYRLLVPISDVANVPDPLSDSGAWTVLVEDGSDVAHRFGNELEAQRFAAKARENGKHAVVDAA